MKKILASGLLALGLIADTITLKTGWNLVGSSSEITVQDLNKTGIYIVWKWVDGKWEYFSPKDNIVKFFSPSYKFFDEIVPHEGFWVYTDRTLKINIDESIGKILSFIKENNLTIENIDLSNKTFVNSRYYDEYVVTYVDENLSSISKIYNSSLKEEYSSTEKLEKIKSFYKDEEYYLVFVRNIENELFLLKYDIKYEKIGLNKVILFNKDLKDVPLNSKILKDTLIYPNMESISIKEGNYTDENNFVVSLEKGQFLVVNDDRVIEDGNYTINDGIIEINESDRKLLLFPISGTSDEINISIIITDPKGYLKGAKYSILRYLRR